MSIKDKILLVGIGNEFRQDDGIGPFIIHELNKKLSHRSCVFRPQGEGIALIEHWHGFPFVILFDAVLSNSPVGSVFRFSIPQQSFPKSMFCCSTHAFSLADVISLAQTLKKLPPKMVIYGIEGERFGNGRGLSPEVRQAGLKVLQQAAEDIQKFQLR